MNEAMKFTVLKKLTVKTVFGKVDLRAIPKNGSLPVMTVFGRVVGTKVISTNLGDSIAFMGDFRAIAADGSRFMSMQCFLPPVCANYLAAAFTPGNPVDFAFKIEVADNTSSPVGYEYTAEPVPVNAHNIDPLQHIIDAVVLKKLPEPPGGMGHGATEKAAAPSKPATKRR